MLDDNYDNNKAVELTGSFTDARLHNLMADAALVMLGDQNKSRGTFEAFWCLRTAQPVCLLKTSF